MLKNTRYKAQLLVVTLWLITQISFAQELEIRELNAPQLSAKHLGKRVLCYRPMRTGSPAMSVEAKDKQIIVNNYGHGGSGWTLAPGSAKYVISLLQQQTGAKQLNTQTPIAVVGAGVIGLFSALELVNQSYTNITIYAEEFDNLTSHKAGGLLAPSSMDNDPESQKNVDDIGIEAYKFYKDIATKKNKQITDGATIMPAYFPTREDSGLEPYVNKVMQPAKDVLVDFKNGTTHQMVVYDDGIFMDTGSLMRSLTTLLKKSNVKFIKKKITNFSNLKQTIIFNCTGNGAKKLANDNKMVSVQGHLIMLKTQNSAELNYMMNGYDSTDKTKHNQNITRSFYCFPKKALHAKAGDVGVIGGTFIENSDSSTPNTEEFDILLQAAKKFYGLESGSIR